MASHYEVVGISSHGELLDQVAEQSGIRTVGINMTRKITPFKDLMALWQMFMLFRKEKPMMVHTHSPKAGLLGMMAAQMAGVPIRLHTVAGLPLLETTGMKRKLLDYMEKLTYACANMVYPNSESMKQIIIKNKYCNSTKLKVIGNGSSNGIDTTHFDPDLFTRDQINSLKASLNILQDDIVFCFVGRVVPPKGIKELVIAFSKINQQVKNTKLLLVGPFEKDVDPLDNFTESQIMSHPSIIWVGFKTDVRPYFAASDIFVFPSYREGFPNVVMQAGAMGIPSIVSNINGCNEIIEDGINGIIIPVKDVPSLQNAMQQLLTNVNLRNSMGAVCRQLIVKRFDQQSVLNELLKEYSFLKRKYLS